MNPMLADRMLKFNNAGLYLVTSSEHSAGRSTETIVEAALEAGVRLVQLREKKLSCRALFDLAANMRRLTRHFDALLIINDRVDVALGVGADGVHLGQADFPVAAARSLGPDLLVGASTHNPAEALGAQQAGASYVNIGPLFPTGTKAWTSDFLGLEGVRRIAPAITIPFSVMGGIKTAHIPQLRDAGAGIIAVVTAVTSAPDPGLAARELLSAIRGEG